MKYITTDEYIQKLNDELKNHNSYQEGMKILPFPEGTKGRSTTGYIFEGSKKNLLVFSEITNKVSKEYSIKD